MKYWDIYNNVEVFLDGSTSMVDTDRYIPISEPQVTEDTNIHTDDEHIIDAAYYEDLITHITTPQGEQHGIE